MEYPVIMLESLLRQEYPKDKIFYVLIDGGSTDRIVSIAKELLRSSGIEYKVIVKESNIPEARNLCIDLAVGDVLVFWDSDVVAPADSLSKVVLMILNSGYDIVAADIRGLVFNDVNSAIEFINTVLNSHQAEVRDDSIVPTDVFVSMGFTAIKKEVFQH